jgi:hypothetical protein
MPKARPITLSIENRPGILGAVASALGARKVNIVAFMAIEGQDAIRPVVDKPAVAKKVFAERGWQIAEEDIVQVTLDDKPGVPGAVASKLGTAGINIKYAYTGSAKSGQKVNTFFAVEDVNVALKAIRLR